jgi:hypothetical protein
VVPKYLIIAAIIFVFPLHILLAHTFIHVSPINNAQVNLKGVRIVFLNLSHRRLEKIVYLTPSQSSQDKMLSLKTPHFTIFSNGHVRLHQQRLPQGYTIYTFKGLKQFKNPELKLNITPQPITKNLNTFLGKTLTSPCKRPHSITSTLEKFFPPTIRKIPQLSRAERGDIGEIITDIIFMHANYPKVGKPNPCNQGFDGIFRHPRLPVLFLTESKCRRESKSPYRYLETDLAERVVAKKVQKLSDARMRTQIQQTLLNSGWIIIKVAQRITNDGQVHTAWAPLDRFLYIMFAYPDLASAPNSVKAWALAELKQRLYPVPKGHFKAK